MRRTADYNKQDHKRKKDILDKLRMKPMIEYTMNYQSTWKERVNGMNRGRILKKIHTSSQVDKDQSDVQ